RSRSEGGWKPVRREGRLPDDTETEVSCSEARGMLHRRDAMMRLGQIGLGALSLPGLLQAESAVTARRRARSCLLLFLWGGPPQQDLWDLKPDAPAGSRRP